MHRNAIWIVFLLLVAVVAIWFFVKAGYDLAHYYRLSVQVPVKVEEWEIKEKRGDEYLIAAQFNFEFEGKEYRGVGTIGKAYPNPWAAKKALEKLSKKEWQVWINPNAPERAVFVKRFPYKAAISAIVLLALAIYFFCLGLFVGGKFGKNRQ